jgi:hypothetical protein
MPMDVNQFKGKTYKISMQGSDQCLTVEGDSVVLLPFGSLGRPEDQLWELIDAGEGRVRIRSIGSRKVLDEMDVEMPLDLKVMPESDTASQFWAIQKAGNEAYQIISTQSGFALTLSPIRIYPPRVAEWTSRVGDRNQEWQLQEA